jgi:hypothetical protein
MPSTSAASLRDSKRRGISRLRAALAIDRVVAAGRRKRTGNSEMLTARWRRIGARRAPSPFRLVLPALGPIAAARQDRDIADEATRGAMSAATGRVGRHVGRRRWRGATAHAPQGWSGRQAAAERGSRHRPSVALAPCIGRRAVRRDARRCGPRQSRSRAPERAATRSSPRARWAQNGMSSGSGVGASAGAAGWSAMARPANSMWTTAL